MSHDHGHHHDSHGHHDTEALFTPAEVAELHRQDLSAGASVVSLISGIFLVGVCLYSVVAYITGSHPVS